MARTPVAFTKLKRELTACTICADHLPLEPRPIFQLHPEGRILIAGQAPGIRAHESRTAWNDPSGVRLRQWLGVSDEEFYDEKKFILLPAGFCYPGTGKSGDLPPRPECRATWHDKLMAHMQNIKVIVLAGMYSQDWFLGEDAGKTLTETVRDWQTFQKRRPAIFPTPHPSPRNLRWLKKNAWFEEEVLPALKRKVRTAIRAPGKSRA